MSEPPQNFKGILLSNRPVANVPRPTKNTNARSPQPFRTGGKVPDLAVGLAPNRERNMENFVAKRMLEDKLKHAPAESVTYKHKKYIKELQAQKQAEKLERMEREMGVEEKKKQFMEQQKTLRLMLKENDYSSKEVSNFLKKGKAKTKEMKKLLAAEEKKPEITKWVKPEHEDVDDEVEDLVDFAHGLDFEKFIDDYEVREALAVIHSRVQEIQSEIGQEEKEILQEKRNERIEERREIGKLKYGDQDEDDNISIHSSVSQRPPTMNPVSGKEAKWDSSVRVDRQPDLVSEVLQNDKEIAQIHSKKSLGKVAENVSKPTKSEVSALKPKIPVQDEEMQIKQLIEEIKQERAKQKTMMINHGIPRDTEIPNAPITKRILTELKRNPNLCVSNLPYLYRCPSI